MKRCLLTVLAVTVLWSLMDMLIHGVILMSTYIETAELWRPMDEMKNGLMSVVTLLLSASFVALFSKFSSRKCPKSGALFGLIYGLGAGISVGYGTYCFMPIPYSLALGWFLAYAVKATAAGALAGLILKEDGDA
jgi:hypothetical protein